jgi:hypothetical protein
LKASTYADTSSSFAKASAYAMPTADETADKTVDKTPSQGSFKVRNANLKLGNSQSHSVNQSSSQPVSRSPPTFIVFNGAIE